MQKETMQKEGNKNGIGGVILHIYEDGSEKAILHAARTLNFSQIGKGAQAITFCNQALRQIVICKKIHTAEGPQVLICNLWICKKNSSSHSKPSVKMGFQL